MHQLDLDDHDAEQWSGCMAAEQSACKSIIGMKKIHEDKLLPVAASPAR
jgi:hypothetical protein